ncbi:uncharacterized protein LOC123542846 isoform X3 [Mercenaria mercenaria]|uniref:uncharacterized protein LOC123542846 isoform X4 n=1 Tax=Mercenaria mercenaria TaxID=6596 RepID=UPI00234EF0AD|nr:uncharacterized protein LOC123542846 isoform X4 [Mercenaria mercenaria]XP_045184803.2 uncharacterized protein LOC123542846 isoform X3 [Mercenaria mercenaria]
MADDPVLTWAKDRRVTIKELKRLGENIKYHASNAKIASAVGGGTSVVAGIGAAGCYFAAPFTAGASLAPAAALTGVAVAGGVTSIGASVTNYFIEKGYTGSVQKALDKDRESFESLKKAIEKAKQITLEEGFEGAVKAGKALPGGVKIGTSVARRLVVSEKAAASLLKLGKTARFASHAVAVIALPLDIIFFVKDVIDLAKGNVSEAANKVFELADQLQKEYDEIMEDTE